MQKRRDIRNIYIDEDFAPVWDKFKKIMEREGSSVSKHLREHIANYVRLHEPGNPQQRLDTIVKIGSCYRVNGCSVPTCGEAGEYVVFKNGVRVLYCERHFWAQPLRGRKL